MDHLYQPSYKTKIFPQNAENIYKQRYCMTHPKSTENQIIDAVEQFQKEVRAVTVSAEPEELT